MTLPIEIVAILLFCGGVLLCFMTVDSMAMPLARRTTGKSHIIGSAVFLIYFLMLAPGLVTVKSWPQLEALALNALLLGTLTVAVLIMTAMLVLRHLDKALPPPDIAGTEAQAQWMVRLHPDTVVIISEMLRRASELDLPDPYYDYAKMVEKLQRKLIAAHPDNASSAVAIQQA